MQTKFLSKVIYLLLIISIAPLLSYSQTSINKSLSGQIIDDQGDPLALANVKIFSKINDSLFVTGLTDSNGNFDISFEFEFPVELKISHPGFVSYSLDFDDPNQKLFTIVGANSKILITKEEKISGQVLTEQNDPLVEASIEIFSKENPTEKIVLESDDSGFFESMLEFSYPISVTVSFPGYIDNKFELEKESIDPLIVRLERLPRDNKFLRISGQVFDKTTDKPIEFVALQIVSVDGLTDPRRPIGVVTDEKGKFDFSFEFTSPYKIRASHISYVKTDILIEKATFQKIEIEMTPLTVEGEVIYVTSQIFPEEELKTSITTDKISSVDVEQVASFSVFDLVSTLREVDVATQSMNLQSVSTRGFNSGANPRFLQLTDGIDNQAPGLGFPVGNLLGPSELDIAGIELIIGPASSRYGSSAMNGALITSSKSPFDSEGVSVSLKTGIHHLKLGGDSPWAVDGDNMFNGTVRIAKSFWDKFAIKLTGTRIQGQDWRATNYDNIGFGKANLEIEDVAGYNGVNSYGDESFVVLPVGYDANDQPNGTFVPVTRTGYREQDLVDYDIATTKAAASLHYKFTPQTELSIEGRYGYTNTLYTSDSRIRLENFEIFQFKGELKSNDFYARAYSTTQKSGDSYSVSYLAQELVQSAKSDRNWYRDYEIAFTRGLPVFGIKSGDIQEARKFADRGATLLRSETALPRFEPGTPEFDAQINALKNTFGFKEGAGIRDDSQLFHIEAGNTSRTLINDVVLNYGANYRFYDLNSNGTIFPDTVGNTITNFEFGGYLQFEKQLSDERLNMIGALRFDKNENFGLRLSQQIGFTYELSSRQFVRFSYQNGFRFPTVREQFLNTNLGNARLLGGLETITESYSLQNNSFYEQSVNDFNEAVNNDIEEGPFDTLAYSRPQAELRNLSILQAGILAPSDLTKIKPEKTNAFEIGYRQLFTDNLYLDLNYFVSIYKDFIGIKRFIKPRTSPTEDLFTAAGQVNSSLESDRFYVYSNASSLVSAHGIAFDLKYSSGTFVSGLNGTFTTLIKSSDDPIIPGYNTPPVKINFEWGNREIIENVGFKFSFKYRSEHEWESSFLDGTIRSYGHFDFQFNIRMPKINSSIKTGVSNMGVLSYYDVYGGPAIGSILFATFTYTPRGL